MGDLFFCGDTHGEFQHVIDAVKLHQPLAIIFLGDLQTKRPLEVELQEIIDLTEVWFIHGNHDTDSDADYDHLFGSELANSVAPFFPARRLMRASVGCTRECAYR